MLKIKSIKAREIKDSNKKPTVEVELKTDFGRFSASVPSGISTGKYEAKTVTPEKAVENIEKVIAPRLARTVLSNQKEVDDLLISLNVGANAVLPVSMAVCRAVAKAKKLPLWQYIANSAENSSRPKLPRPSFNMIEGGKHVDPSGGQGLIFQEFMIIPQKESFSENFKIGKEIYKSLGKILEKKFGKKNVTLSREGAFCPPIQKASEAIDLILEVAGNSPIKIAIDAAASEFYQNGSYRDDSHSFPGKELGIFYNKIIEKYPIISLEDPFAEEDYEAWSSFKPNILVFGDDLTTTNLERIKMAKDKNLCNAVIIKPNQIGTVTETVEAAKLAQSYGWKIMVANRAGETMDDFIADLAVGINADFIKSGAPLPKERLAKYNRLAKIEKEIRKSE